MDDDSGEDLAAAGEGVAYLGESCWLDAGPVPPGLPAALTDLALELSAARGGVPWSGEPFSSAVRISTLSWRSSARIAASSGSSGGAHRPDPECLRA